MRPRAQRVVQATTVRTGQKDVDRALDSVRSALHDVAARPRPRVLLRVKLVSGLNKIDHGLSSPPLAFSWNTNAAGGVVSDAQTENPFPARQLWVRLSGAASANATLVVY